MKEVPQCMVVNDGSDQGNLNKRHPLPPTGHKIGAWILVPPSTVNRVDLREKEGSDTAFHSYVIKPLYLPQHYNCREVSLYISLPITAIR